jgi:hypothetical protein
MNLKQSVAALKAVSKDASSLKNALQTLAQAGKNATATQKSNLKSLATRLGAAAKDGARERRLAEIGQLSTTIKSHETSLSVPGLPSAIRRSIRSDLTALKARRVRLNARLGSDFGGVLTAAQIRRMDALVKKVKQDTAQKKAASAFLEGAEKIADLSLTIAGKLAL